MDTLAPLYHFWLVKLGWATAEMLTLVTRGVPQKNLPGKRDRTLEAYLRRQTKAGKLQVLLLGGTRVYGLIGNKPGKNGHVVHDLMAAQAIVKLWREFSGFKEDIFSPSTFFAQSLSVVPDFALRVQFPAGVHAFALEYQSLSQGARRTGRKLEEYLREFAALKKVLEADALWVIVIFERDTLWVKEFARHMEYEFVYVIDSATFFATPDISRAPVFLKKGAESIGLVSL